MLMRHTVIPDSHPRPPAAVSAHFHSHGWHALWFGASRLSHVCSCTVYKRLVVSHGGTATLWLAFTLLMSFMCGMQHACMLMWMWGALARGCAKNFRSTEKLQSCEETNWRPELRAAVPPRLCIPCKNAFHANSQIVWTPADRDGHWMPPGKGDWLAGATSASFRPDL